ncbi:hypothetical protein N0O92_03645 [Alkalihalobacillus sp. MEB130]|uniref:hypothetical protein n=1 Tax=Alkalihalobacillus sp. MEB130 TaxID=2976704 RepID=UPI0028DF0988|nr:hypothetical protein [Alkalihalobacillus sp. MEB130]MDT8859314.1 hypothetical protein [Alkalihalobacillus sp. MEB130]
MQEVSMMDLATVSAVVAALVTVIGNAFGVEKQYRALLAIGIAGILWFIPREWGEQVLMALIIGLTASGVYSQVKPRDNENELMRMQLREEFRREQEIEREQEDRRQRLTQNEERQDRQERRDDTPY